MSKSLLVAYVLWLFGGFVGLHHVYLGRYKHAFVWWCLPGGYFGMGWFRELWRIPEYVRDANLDAEHVKTVADKMRKRESPPFSFLRAIGQLLLANTFGTLAMIAPPAQDDELGPGVDFQLAGRLLAPSASALAIWIVGNIGCQRGGFVWPLVGCYLGFPLYHWGFAGYNAVSIAGILAFHCMARSWRRAVTKPVPFSKGFLCLFLCCGLYSSLWSSYIYFNMTIVTSSGDEVPFRDAAGNFLKSPAFQEFSKQLGSVLEKLRSEGFSAAWDALVDSLDPLGERNAFKVLELPVGTSQEEIKARYRELSKKWHPDKFKEEDKKSDAHEKFVQIQQAYECLSQIKKRRSQINKGPS